MHAHSSFEAAGPAPAAARASANRTLRQRLVTDAPTRMFHWLFALTFVGAYATAESEHWRLLHVSLGYAMAGLLGFRLLYSLFGPRQARVGGLWRKLASAPAWLKSFTSGAGFASVNWRQGQNLLMALAVVLLLALVLPVVLSGYATYNDWGGAFGGDWLEDVHGFFGEAMLMVVLAHLGLIAGLSLLRGRNQAAPMISGRSEGSGPDLVQANRIWLAVLLFIAVIGFVAWQWQAGPEGVAPAGDGVAQSMRDQHARDD